MPRTAQEWKDLLNLDELPDPEYLASLNALEGQDVIEGGIPDGQWIIVNDPSEILAFKTEAEGAKFWDTHAVGVAMSDRAANDPEAQALLAELPARPREPEVDIAALTEAWQRLCALAPVVCAPITDEASLERATDFLDALDQEMGETPGHPLVPLADGLMHRIVTYEKKHFPPAAPDMELRLLLKERGVTQGQLAYAAQLSRHVVSDLVHGKQPFTESQARAVARFFGVKPDVFLTG